MANNLCIVAALLLNSVTCLRLGEEFDVWTEGKLDRTNSWNPLLKIAAAKGKNASEVLKSLKNTELQKLIKTFQPGKKGNCADGEILASALIDDSDDKQLPKCQCPAAGKTGGKSSEEVKKYSERANDGKCDEAKGMWNAEAAAAVLRYKYETVARMFHLNKAHRVLDWGAGCGHQLGLIADTNGFHAVGIDLVPHNEEWVKKNLHKSFENFCTVDGSGGIPFAKNSFDLVMSNAALYHLKGLDAQCKVLTKEVPHVLVPGGCAWFGWLGSSDSSTSGTITPEVMKHCFSKTNLQVEVFNEQQTFGVAEYDDRKSYSVLFCKPHGEGKKEEKKEHPGTTPHPPPPPVPPPQAPPPGKAAQDKNGKPQSPHNSHAARKAAAHTEQGKR